MIDADVKLILILSFIRDPRKVVGGAAGSRVWITHQQTGSNCVKGRRRNQIAGVGAMIRRSKDLTHAWLNRVAIRIDDRNRIGCDGRGDRTIALKEQRRAQTR
jgi:hypothetical protein